MIRRGKLAHRDATLSWSILGDGPPVVFIQGVGVHGEGWRPQVDELGHAFRCLWFDHRGIGESEVTARGLSGLTIESMADDVLALMDAQGWSSAHIVGHSMGGAVAQALALEHRERVRSLSLLCTFARFRDSLTISGRLLRISLRTRVGTRRMRRHAFLELVMPPPELVGRDQDALASELEPLFGHDLGVLPRAAGAQGRALARYDSSRRLGELAGLPTLVVCGEHDPISPPTIARRLAEGIPGARYEEIADASHGVTLQRAGRINSLLAAHLRAADRLRAT